MLDQTLAPRLTDLHVWAVEQLESVFLLPVTNRATAAAEGVVTNGGHKYVERRKQRTALLVARQGGDSSDEAATGQDAPERPDVYATDSACEMAAYCEQHGLTEAEPQDSPLAAAAADTVAAGRSGCVGAASEADGGAENAAAGDVSSSSSIACDALYVVAPDSLMECSAEVAQELGGFIAAAAEEAGVIGSVQQGVVAQLLEKLLMVQVGVGLLCCWTNGACAEDE